MFWNKKKENIIQKSDKCEVNRNLPECKSVLNLRNYQQQLKEVEEIDLRKMLHKYFNILEDSYLISEMYYFERYLFNLIHTNNTPYTSYEERFKEFGKQLDSFIQKEKLTTELKEKIKVEKDKLGIE